MVFILPTVLADRGEIEIYKPQEVFDLSIHLTNRTGDVLGATCKAEIRNETYGVLDTITLNEINGGWYNATYNTSKVGKYFCKQNCTQGTFFAAETCDFVIEGDETVSITIAIIIIGTAILFFILSYTTKALQHPALKLFFLIIAMIVVLIGLNFAYINAIDNGASTNVQDLLSSLYRVGLYSFVIFMIYVVIYHVLFPVFMHFRQYRGL